ncbi:efflux RND transporter periplasmic adaptor subunit [Roseivirga sp.]|uniref:efflux RND transporter periplasmic adaptor subunit n=1 Tax=Roseivirga sp. TaxID=1964215 RepID=UPI003B524C38
MKKRILFIMSLCALVLYTSCESEKHENEHELAETKFQVTSPVRKDTLQSLNYVCQIRSIRNIELRALEEGYLEEIYVDEGQFVKKGQKMFKIMPMLYEAELKKAEAEAQVAEIEYRNAKSLADQNVISQNELALAEAHFNKAKAEVALAEAHLGFTLIKAPFDGILNRLEAREGSLLEEGELLTSFSDNSKMWVYFNVPEAEYLDFQTNAKKGDMNNVHLLMANGKLFSENGVVETIEGEFNNETGNIAFRATFPNPDRLLRHGETGNVLIDIPLENALIIPQKATFEVLDKKYVYVVGEDNIIRSREIKIEEELPHIYVISEGLEENDKILLEGLRLVRENQEISYDFLPPTTVMSGLDLYAE